MKRTILTGSVLTLIWTLLMLPACSTEEPYDGPAPDIYIIPEPVETAFTQGTFSYQDIGVSAPSELTSEAEFLMTFVRSKTTADVSRTAYGDKNARIFLELDKTVSQDEGYTLKITQEQVIIRGRTTAGVFYGLQTLRQLLPQSRGSKPKSLTLPCLKITDAPRFSYRGMHLDVSRHFFGPEVVKRYLDVMARYKLNRFHWHLTDDQGWRIPIDAYPKLNTISSWRDETLVGHYNDKPWKYDGKRSGGFYTKDEVRDIVSYAAARHIIIVPEVEMPGHSQAILAAYPEFGCTGEEVTVRKEWGISDHVLCPGEETFAFLEAILDEVMALFPGKYIHIGGDECPKTQWEQSPFCQELMQREGLKDEMELQSWFVQRIGRYLNAHDKVMIGWDEILEGGLAPNAVVMSWRGFEGGIEAAKQEHDVIMTPTSHVYFDYYQSTYPEEPLAIGGYLPLREVYGFEPIPDELPSEFRKHILGAQGNVWTEYMATPLHLDYMAWPRGVALAEVVWSPVEKHDFNDFTARLENHIDLLRGDGIYVANHLYELKYVTRIQSGELFIDFVKTIPDNVVLYSTDGEANWLPSGGSLRIDSSMTLVARLETKKGVSERALRITIDKHLGAGKSISLTSQPQPQYNNGGIQSMVNGILGSDSRYGDAEWRGFSGDNLEAVIDLEEVRTVSGVETRFFHAPGQWIYLPTDVTVLLGESEESMTEVGKMGEAGKAGEVGKPGEVGEAGPSLFQLTVRPTSARYVKIVAKNFGRIPDGNQGAGNDAWLFVDEIVVR